jgi:phosphate/sulfate permease
VSAAVATVHGSRIAKWRNVLFVAVIGFLIGGMTSSALVTSYFDGWLVELKLGTVSTADLVCLSAMLVGVLFVTLLLLIVGVTFGLALAPELLLIVGIAMGAYSLGLPISFMRLGSLLAANGIVMLMAVSLSAGVYFVLQKFVMEVTDPLSASLSALPYLLAGLVPIHVAMLVATQIWFFTKLESTWVHVVGLAVLISSAGLCILAARLLMVNKTKRHVFERYPQHVLEYSPGRGEEMLAERGMVVGRHSPAPSTDSEASLSRARAEESFVWLLLISAGLAAAVQGTLGVGALVGVYRIFMAAQVADPNWAFIICPILVGLVGIVALTNRTMWKLANEISSMTPSLAMSIELGCFIPTVMGIWLGWPISPVLIKLPAMLMVAILSKRVVRWRETFYYSIALIGGPILMAGMAVAIAKVVVLLFQWYRIHT